MRSNSGKDESRNNLHDPTMRDRSRGRGDPTPDRRKPKAPADHRAGPQGLSGSGSSRRSGRARGSAPACRPAPASRARFRPRACPRPRRRSATGYRRGPGPALAIAASKRRRASICAPVRSGSGADAAAARARPAPQSHAMVTRGASCAALPIGAQPLPGVELALADSPRANSQPSGDSARLTVTERRPAARPARSDASRLRRRSRVRCSNACLPSPCPSLPSSELHTGLPHRQICRTVEKPYWLHCRGRRDDHANPGSAPRARHDARRCRAALRPADHAADHRPARDRARARSRSAGSTASPRRSGSRRRTWSQGGETAELKVVAVLGPGGAAAPKRAGDRRPAAQSARARWR